MYPWMRMKIGMGSSRRVLTVLVVAAVLLPLAVPEVFACALGDAPRAAKSCCCRPGGAFTMAAPTSEAPMGGCCELRKAPGPQRSAVLETQVSSEGRPDRPSHLPFAEATLSEVDHRAPICFTDAGGAPPGDPPELLRLNCLLLI